MRVQQRRQWLLKAMGLSMLPILGAVARRAAGAEQQVVKMVAQRFNYTPAEFRVKAGVPVVLEFTSLDFVHGFNLPQLKTRADLPPGRMTRVELPASPPGIYDFVCDNFCGDQHEEMHGRMIVEA
jgi:cytochrome c oxidase subunit 2